jgi:hypothetical protein
MSAAREPKPRIQEISIKVIIRDETLQPRSRLDPDVIHDYAEALKNGATFPPVAVFFDGKDYYLADGYQRTAAHEAIGRKSIRAYIYHGDKRDATLYSVGANAEHGVRRTNEDKRKAVIRLLDDPEWSLWADVVIARHVKVSESTVHRYRQASPGVIGHDVGARVNDKNEIFSVVSPSDAEAAIPIPSNIDPETFIRPPTPLTSSELKHKFLERIERSLKRAGIEVSTNVIYEFGEADIVTPEVIYFFTTIHGRSAFFNTLGRVVLARACINPKARITLVGNYHRSFADLIAGLAKLKILCKTPDQVLKLSKG